MYLRRTDFDADLARTADWETDPELLEKLLKKHHGELAIAEAVARNPACPRLLFFSLWRYMQPIAETNPTLESRKQDQHWEVAIRRKPRIDLSRWSREVSDTAPEIYKVVYLMEHGLGEYQRYLMGLPAIPDALIREHATSKSASLRKVIASRETAPEDVFEALAKDGARTVREALAANPHATPEVIASLTVDAHEAVARAARNNPSCPDEAVHRARLADAQKPADTDLAKLKFMDLARLVSKPDASVATLSEFAAHQDPCLRFLCGINPSTPTSALERLARDGEVWVRESAGFNPNTPLAVLSQLADTDDKNLQRAVASNPSLSEEDQLKLAGRAKDEAAQTLANLTQYPSVWAVLASATKPVKKASEKTWRHFLAETLDGYKTGKFTGLKQGPKSHYLCVTRAASRSEKCPRELAAHYAYYLFEDYSQSPAAALALLEGKTHVKPRPYLEWKMDQWLGQAYAPGLVANYFIRSDHTKRRAQAISSPHTELVYVLHFVLDENTTTRKRLAQREDLNRFCFEVLARDEKPGVREQLAKNKKCPRALLAILSTDNATTVKDVASKRAAKSAAKSAKNAKVANQGSATERARLGKRTEDLKVLRELSTDRAASLRLVVSQNRHTPTEVYPALAKDPDSRIRATVALRSRERSIVEPMLEDSELGVRLSAAKNSCWYTYHREGRIHDYDQAFLARMAQSPDPELRTIAAEHVQDRAIHHKLMHDDPSVTIKLARNRFFSEEDKLALAELTDNQDILAALAGRTENEALFLLAASKITSSHVDDPIRCHGDMLSRPKVQDALCTHPLRSVRSALTRQRVLTPTAVEALSQDENDSIRDSMTRRK